MQEVVQLLTVKLSPSFKLSITKYVKGVAAAKTAIALGPGHRIVTILCDSGNRHISRFWAQVDQMKAMDSDATLDEVLNSPNTS